MTDFESWRENDKSYDDKTLLYYYQGFYDFEGGKSGTGSDGYDQVVGDPFMDDDAFFSMFIWLSVVLALVCTLPCVYLCCIRP